MAQGDGPDWRTTQEGLTHNQRVLVTLRYADGTISRDSVEIGTVHNKFAEQPPIFDVTRYGGLRLWSTNLTEARHAAYLEETHLEHRLIVTAWQPLPEPYYPEFSDTALEYERRDSEHP